MTTADLTVYSLRKGTPDDPTPLHLGLYQQRREAARHGEAAFAEAFGTAYDLRWFPDSGEDDATWTLYCTDGDGEEVETEWHIVPLPVAASYDPDAEA